MSQESGETMSRGWELVQIKAFTAWLNGILATRDAQITDIKTDLSDGVKLIWFLELLSGKKITTKYDLNPPLKIQKIQNLNVALSFIEKEMDPKLVRLSGVGVEDFVDSNLKMILGFLWSMFKKYRIQTIKQDDKSSEEGLLLWVKKTTDGYADVKIENYRHSFRDGLAFAALCDNFIDNKELFDFAKFSKDAPADNLNAAFDFAEKEMGIPKLLDADEVVSGSIDERSMVLYISLYFHAFVAKEQQKGMLVEKERIAEKMKGLEDSLEERAKKAAILQEQNEALTTELETVRNQLQSEQASKAQLLDKITHLEEKVDVLKQLYEEEHEGKTELEQLTENQAEQIADLKSQIETWRQRDSDRDGELARLREELERERSKTKDLSENKLSLEQQIQHMQGEMDQMASNYERESTLRQKDGQLFASLKETQTRGLNVLQKNLEEHIEDLHRWEKFLDLGETPEFGELRTHILKEITNEDYDAQLKNLADRLDVENRDLLEKLKAKEAEAKQKQLQEKAKKERQAKTESNA